MPRETRPPRPNVRPAGNLSPQKHPIKIPLNDDREEKAVRFHSRQALHEIQMNQIKAAASPIRKRRSIGPGGSPQTPGMEDQENGVGHALTVVGGTAVTPMKRVPILANFEEWMKMATDNKINATNSWNFALIDYFHDMSLLKEGDGVNFQKASCTLDGCVKIYTSRVDSVATETGKLLSGLADSGNKKRKGEEDDLEQGEEGEEGDGEEGDKKRSRKRVQRSSEATLASSFAQLQLKKMELEFSVDPLFKKASADFDEGGAKGLLLNHLTIDAQGRIVFDSSDDTQQATEAQGELQEANDDEEGQPDAADTPIPDHLNTSAFQQDFEVDIESLATRFFPDLSRLDEQDICPSLKSFELGGADDALNLPFLKAPEDWRKDQNSTPNGGEGDENYDDNPRGSGFDDDDEAAIGGFDVIGDVGFGEGGEAWAKEAAIDTQGTPFVALLDDGIDVGQTDGEVQEVRGFEANSAQYGITLVKEKEFDRENILSYFDQALQKNWAGPEHWRIRKIKDSSKPAAPTTKRKEKEPFEVNFMAPLTQAMADVIYTPAASNAAISLPKSQWKSRSRNLLPDDKHFNSRQLLSLFLKPKARIGARRAGERHSSAINGAIPEGEIDEVYWARQQNAAASQESDEQPAQGNYDADFFQDDGLGLPTGMPDDDDENFADAREDFMPDVEGGTQLPLSSMDNVVASGSQGDGFGTQLVTQSRRLRPEYVQYARVAKKVDVRRLKEEMWRGIGLDESLSSPPLQAPPPSQPPAQPLFKQEDGALRFTSVMNNLQSVYPKQAMADISTSFCFICLLHLANEKGLVLQSEAGFEEIRIQKDHTAENTGVGD